MKPSQALLGLSLVLLTNTETFAQNKTQLEDYALTNCDSFVSESYENGAFSLEYAQVSKRDGNGIIVKSLDYGSPGFLGYFVFKYNSNQQLTGADLYSFHFSTAV